MEVEIEAKMKKMKKQAGQFDQLSRHQKLERRRLLNADFGFAAGELELTSFVDSVAMDPDSILIEQTGADAYQITIDDGIWNGADVVGVVTGNGTNVLSLDNSLGAITSILARSNTADSFDIGFGDFTFAGDVTIEQDVGGTAFGTVSQQAGTAFVQTGTLEITAADTITLNDTSVGNDFDILDIQNAVTVSLDDINDVNATALDASGDVTVSADGNVTLNGAAVGGNLDVTTTSGDINVDATGGLNLATIDTDDGAVDITTTGDISIGSIEADATIPTDATVDINSTAGSINDLQDDSVVDISATGTIQLNAADEIGGMSPAGAVTDVDGRLELAADSVLETTSTTGNVVIDGLGDLTLQDVVSTAGSVDVLATGDVLVGTVTASTTIDVSTTAGSINDQQDDLASDFTAGGLITLTSADEIGGIPPAGLTTDPDGKLEFEDGSTVVATATTGNIALRGVGEITLQDVQAFAGSINVMAAGDVLVGQAIADTTVDILTTAGAINDQQDDLVADISAGGLVTLTATDEIGGIPPAGLISDPDGKLEVAAATIVSATSATGDIALRGLGDITLENVEATTGAVDVMAAGDVLIGTVTAGTTIDVSTTAGSINDLQDDLLADFVAGGLVTLSATDEVGGNSPAGLIGDPDGKLEIEDSTSVSATSATGDIALLGLGDITLENVEATTGAVDVMAAGDVLVGAVTAGTTIDVSTTAGSINDQQDDLLADFVAGGLVTLSATDEVGGNPIAGLISDPDGKLEVAAATTVSGTSATGDIAIRGLGDITLENVEATTGAVDVMAAGDVLIGTVTAGTTIGVATTAGSINDQQDDLLADFVAGGLVTLSATDEVGGNPPAGLVSDPDGKLEVEDAATVAVTSATGDIALRGLGDITLENVEATAGAVDVMAAGDVLVGAVTAGTTIDIASAGGSINDLQDDLTNDFTAGGLITLSSVDEIGGNPPAGLATDPDGKLEFADGSVVVANATTGNIALRGLGDITLQDVQALVGSVDVMAAGDVLVGQVIADTNIDILTTAGSINDQQDDLIADFFAGGLVTLTATDEIGGNPPAGLVTDTAGKLEFNNGVTVVATSATGDIAVRGLGDLTLQTIEATAGAVDVMAAGDVLVGSITAGTTIDVLTTAGSINDLQDDLIADFTSGGIVTLTSTEEIGGMSPAGAVTDTSGKLEFADGSVVIATATTGDIAIRGLGGITLQNVQAGTGSVDVMAAGDVLVGQVLAGLNIDILTTVGSINDQQDDLIADFFANGVVTLTATDEIGGNPPAGLINDTAGKLEFDDGVIVVANSTTGNIALRGLGDLTLQTIEATAGSVDVMAAGDVSVGSVTAGTTIDVLSSGGSINDLQDDLAVDFTAGGTISLTADDEVGGNVLAGAATDTSQKLEFAAGSVVDATSTNGDIAIRGLGDITLPTIVAANGSVDVMAAGDVLVGSITAGTTIDVLSTGGSINDLQDDLAVDFTAGGTINLTANDEVGGNVVAGDATDANQKLEFAAGSIVNATSTTGDVVLRGLGDITLQDIESTTGAVDIMAAGDVLIGEVTAGTTIDVLTTAGGINDLSDDLAADFDAGGTITLTAPEEIGGNVVAGATTDTSEKLEFADGSVVVATSATGNIAMRGLGDLTLQDIESTAGSVDVMAAGDVFVGEVTAATTIDVLTSGGAINDLQDDLAADLIAGSTITLTAANEIGGNVAAGMGTDTNQKLEVAANSVVDATSTGGDIALRGLGDVTLQNIQAPTGSVDVMAAGDVLIGSVTAGTTIDVLSTGGSINDLQDDLAADFTAGGAITLTANDEIGGSVVAGSTNDPNQKLEFANGSVVNASSTTGNVALRGLGDITLQTVSSALGSVNAMAAGDVLVGSVTASTTIDISTTGGSINDLQDDLLADLAAGGTITLSATDEIGGNVTAGAANDADQKLEVAAGATVDVTSTTSDIALRGLGDLDLLSVTAGGDARLMAAGSANVIGPIDTVGKTRIDANFININAAIDASFVFLGSATGVTQLAGAPITAGSLELSGAGLFNLIAPLNDVDLLAADIDGNLNYVDADDLRIAELNCDGDVICGLIITGNLNLTTNNGDLTQAANPAMPSVDSASIIVGGDTTITTGTGDICLTGGDCTGDGINDNRFDGTLTLSSSGDVVIAENDDITIDSVVGGGSYRFIGNNIQINTAIVGNQLLLEASDGVDYNGNLIDVTDLMLVGIGRFDFGEAGDPFVSIDNLAADIDGALTLNNDSAIDIGNLEFVSDCGNVPVCGVNIDVGGGEAGDLTLILANANLTQTAGVMVEGTTTLDAGTGTVCLTGGGCTMTMMGIPNENDFNVVMATGSTVEIVDVNDLTAGNIAATNDIFLRAGDSAATTGTLSINGNLTATAGQVLLQSDTAITQLATSVIDANDLLVGSDSDADARAGSATLIGQNEVNNLAVRLDNAFVLNNVQDLNVSTVDYVSACGTAESHIGLNVVGADVALTVDGNLTLQQNAIVTGGDLLLDVSGDVTQLATGQIDADGLALAVDGTTILDNPANNIDVLATTNGGPLRFTDIDDLKIGTVNIANPVTSTTGLSTVDSDVKLTVGGNLTLEEAVAVGAGDLFLDVASDVSQIAAGTISANGLGLDVTGETVLNNTGNSINVLAANNDSDLSIASAGDLKVGEVTIEAITADRAMTFVNGSVAAAAMSVVGITTTNDNALLVVDGNLTLEQAVSLGTGGLFADVAGDLTQLNAGTITATGLGLMVEGNTVLVAANDVDELASIGGAVHFNDISDLKIGSVNVDAIIADRAMTAMNGTVASSAASLTGLTNTDQDVKLTAAGNLTVEQAVVLGTGDLFLDVDGDVSQINTGTIQANGLGLMVDGSTVLNGAPNDLNIIAANTQNAIVLNNSADLKVGSVTAEAVTANRAMTAMNGSITSAAMTLTGLTTTNDDAKLSATGNLTVEESVSLGTGDFFVTATGDVTQLGTGTIQANGLGLLVNGTTVLNEANSIDELAADNGGAAHVTSVNDLKVGTVIAEAVSADRAMAAMNGTVTSTQMEVIGLTTIDADAKLVATGNLTFEQQVNLGTGDLFLDVDGDVSQLAAGTIEGTVAKDGTIQARGLGLIVDGQTVLNNVGNDVDEIAIDSQNAVQYTDANDLKVGIVSAEAVTAERAMTAMNGSISTVAMELTGATTTDDDVKLSTAGNLTLEQQVNLGAGDFVLDVDGDLTQLSAGTVEAAVAKDGTIQAQGLGLNVTGNTILNNVGNDVDIIAADGDGAIQYTDANDLKVGQVVAEAVVAERAMTAMNGTVSAIETDIIGITTTDDDVKLTAAGNLTIEQAVALGTGDLFLDVDGDVTQLATGTVTANGLGLMVGGETILDNNANSISVVAATTTGPATIATAGDLKVGDVTIESVTAARAMLAMNGSIATTAMDVSGITTTNNDFKLVAGGNLTLEQQVSLGTGDLVLDVDGDVSQIATGSIQARGLGLSVDGVTLLNNTNNNVDELAADNGGATQYTDADDLKVGTVTFEAITADRAMAAMNGSIIAPQMVTTGVTTTDDDVKLTVINGNLTLEQQTVLGDGDLFLNVNGDVTQLTAGTIEAAIVKDGTIQARGLGLNVTGETILNNADNEVDEFAANNTGSTQYTDTNDLKVGTITIEAVTANRAMAAMNGTTDSVQMQATALTTVNSDAKLHAGGNLTFEQFANLGTGDLHLDVNGDLTQLDTGNIIANGLGLEVDGTTVLVNPNNNVAVIAADNDGATHYRDADSLAVGTVTTEAISADRAMSAMNPPITTVASNVVGITTSDDDVKLVTGGDLAIEQFVNLGDGDLFLDADGNVSQSALGDIQSRGLRLAVTGTTILNNPANDVDEIAANNGANQGAIQFIDVDDLTVGTVTIEDVTADRAMSAMLGSISSTGVVSVSGVNVTGAGIGLSDANFNTQIDLLDNTAQTETFGGQLIYNKDFAGYLTGLDAENGGAATSVGLALLANGDLDVITSVNSTADVFVTTGSAGDITVSQNIVTAAAADKILVVAADQLNLNARLLRGADGAVFDVSNLNPDVPDPAFFDPALILNPGAANQSLALIDSNTLTQMFLYTFGQTGEQNFTTSVFFGVELASYDRATFLAEDFPVVDFVVPSTLADLNNILFELGVKDFESRSFYQDALGGQASILNESQPIDGPNDLLPMFPGVVFPASASFSFDFLNANPEFRSIAFVFNDAGINIFDNATGSADVNGDGLVDGLRDLNVAVEDLPGLANIGLPPVIEIERTEFQIADRVEITPIIETEFFQTAVVTDAPLFTQTVQDKFFVVVYFESQAEADNFEAEFEKLDTSETGEKDYDKLQDILKDFGSLEFKADGEDELLDANKIREIFEEAELDLDGDEEQWQKTFQDWLKQKEFDDEAPEVPRGVFKIIEVENGRAIIQGDDVDRRFVPEPDNNLKTEDYPFDVPSDVPVEDQTKPLQLKPPVGSANDGASIEAQPLMSERMARWTGLLNGQAEITEHGLPSADQTSPDLTDVASKAAVTTSALGLLGLVCHRNAAKNRTAADEISDFAKAKAEQPKRNIFSKASRFRRRNQNAFNDKNNN